MAMAIYDTLAPIGAGQESLQNLICNVDSFTRHSLHTTDLHHGPWAGALTEQLGYEAYWPVVVELPNRQEYGSSIAYIPGSNLTNDNDDHVRGITGLLAGAKKLDAFAKAELIKEVVYAASTAWFEAEEDFAEPVKIASRAMSAHHARQLALGQLDGMLVVAELRRRELQPGYTTSGVEDLATVRAELIEAWRLPETGRTVAAIGAVMAGAALLLAVKKRRD
jgi:LPXTG-motif cell wall-anchored protein